MARHRYIAFVTLNAMLQYELQWQNAGLLEELRTPFTSASHELPPPMVSPASGLVQTQSDGDEQLSCRAGDPSPRHQRRRRPVWLDLAAVLAVVLSAILVISRERAGHQAPANRVGFGHFEPVPQGGVGGRGPRHRW